MSLFRYIILSFMVILVSCNDPKRETDKSTIAEQAVSKFKEALSEESAGNYWQSIAFYNESDQFFIDADSSELIQYQHLLHRFKGKMLAKVGLPGEAVKSLQLSLEYLSEAPVITLENKNRKIHEIGTKRYIGSYLRQNGQYIESNEIFIDLLKLTAKSPTLHAEFKNLIGLNYLALQKHNEAFRMFDDVLKISVPNHELKAHYLDNWAIAAFHIGLRDQAFGGLSEAIGIDVAKEKSLAEMQHRMNLGELYLLDKKYELANSQFDKALEAYPNLDENPSLFKIYNLKYTVASVMGRSDANDFKLRYDSLLLKNQKARKSYSAQQQFAILTAQMDKLDIESQRNNWLQSIRTYSVIAIVLGVLAMLVVMISVMYFRKTRLVKKEFSSILQERLQ